MSPSQTEVHTIFWFILIDWGRHDKKMTKKIHFCTLNEIEFPVPVLTLSVCDLQLQISLTQQVMTSSLDEEVRWPQQSEDDRSKQRWKAVQHWTQRDLLSTFGSHECGSQLISEYRRLFSINNSKYESTGIAESAFSVVWLHTKIFSCFFITVSKQISNQTSVSINLWDKFLISSISLCVRSTKMVWSQPGKQKDRDFCSLETDVK